jgi:hypothetical protein
VFAAMVPMAKSGVSDTVVYGLYPVAAPLILAGPAGARAVAGVGECIVLLGSAAVIDWQQRRA